MKSVARRDAHGLDVRHLDQQHALVDHPASQPRQNRRRILHVLERVIHRDDVEAAGRKGGVLHEAGRDRHPERLARVARVLFVGFEARRVEAELPQHVDHLAAAGAGVENAIAALQIRRERAIAIQRAAARPRDVAQRRRGAVPCSRAGIRSSSTAALLLRPGRGFDQTSPHLRQIVVRSGRPSRSRSPITSTSDDAAQIAGDRALNHDWRPGRTAAAPTRRGNSSASDRTSAAARARRSRPAGDP